MSDFVYLYRYYDTGTSSISYTTNTVKAFPAGTPNVQVGSQALIESGMDELWVTGPSQFDDEAVFNSTVTFNGPVTFEQPVDLELPKIDLYSSSVITIATAPPGTSVPFDNQRQINSNYFDHSTTLNNTDITILENGTYKIDAKVTTSSTAGGRTNSRFDILLDTGGGPTLVPGTAAFMYNRNNAQGAATGFSTCTLTLNANDIINVNAYRSSGSGTIIFNNVGAAADTNGVSLTIVKL